jgi:hypothetical protein
MMSGSFFSNNISPNQLPKKEVISIHFFKNMTKTTNYYFIIFNVINNPKIMKSLFNIEYFLLLKFLWKKVWNQFQNVYQMIRKIYKICWGDEKY